MENFHVTVPLSLHFPKVTVWVAISSKALLDHFSDTKRLLQRSILMFYVNLWPYKSFWNTVGMLHGPCQDGTYPDRTSEVFHFHNGHFNVHVGALD